ncbi:MAG: hypothetical protein Q8R82_18970, partial [Hyphomonadaceae bacterium]|nr:hypothetical protein [Hyphomonadaceae bacterium]
MTAARNRLPYAFARRAGVIDAGGDTEAQIVLREGADPVALLEVRRVLGLRLIVDTVPAAEFEKRLSECYSAAGIALDSAEEIERS